MGNYDHLKGHDPSGEEAADTPTPAEPEPVSAPEFVKRGPGRPPKQQP